VHVVCYLCLVEGKDLGVLNSYDSALASRCIIVVWMMMLIDTTPLKGAISGSLSLFVLSRDKEALVTYYLDFCFRKMSWDVSYTWNAEDCEVFT